MAVSDELPMLSVHEAAPADKTNTTGPANYIPDPEEKKTLKLVEKLFQKSKTHRKTYDQNWLDNYKMFRGKQWKEQRPTYRHSEAVNLIFRDIQTSVPIITDARPRIEYVPENPSDRDFATIVNEIAESDWQKNNWLMVLTEVVYDAHIYSCGLGYMGWDPKASYGIGGIEHCSEDPTFCFPDPNAYDVNKKCSYFIVAKPTDLSEIKKDYPEKGKFVKSDVVDLIGGNRQELDMVRFRSPVDNNTVTEGTSPYDMGSKDQALKMTVWIYDEETVEEEITKENPETGESLVSFETKKKYPNGRKIVSAGGVVLEDGDNPYEDGKIPYARFVNYILPREFWGISEVEQLKSPQIIFNKLISFALDVLTLMGNPIWVVDTTAGIDTDNLFNRPGLIIEKEPGSDVRREPGVELQPYVLQMIDRMKLWFDDIGGSNDVSRGANPSGITAAAAITSLQEAAQTRMRLKARNLDAYLQDLGRLYLSRVFQFYSSPRIVRLTGNQEAQKYFKFHIDSVDNVDPQTGQPDGTQKKIARVTDMGHDPETGQLVQGNQRELEITGEFDVRVSTGSSLPFAKADKFNQAKELFQLGVIDDQELLKTADYPNWEAVLERVHAKQAQQAQAQQAGGGGQAQPGHAPPPQTA